MFTKPIIRRQVTSHNTGSITFLVLFLLTVMLIMAAISIEVARVELAETELQVATDGCARLAMSKLAETQDPEVARQYAINKAASYTVAGQTFALSGDDVQFGNSERQASGAYNFVDAQVPLNAVRINSTFDRFGSQSLPVAFDGLFGDKSYRLATSAVAANSDVDVVLVLDRSASMSFDMAGIDWQYPRPLRLPDAYLSAPHNTKSRWAALQRALDVFVDEMTQGSTRTQVGVSSYSSNTGSNYYGVWCSSVASTRELEMTDRYSKISSVVSDIGGEKLIGGTNISAGMYAGQQILASSPRVTANKIMIVLTDGFYNEGQYPPQAAEVMAEHGIVVHAVTFGSKTDTATMQQVADRGKGIFYEAPDEATLKEVFRKLARNLAIKVIQ